MKKLLLLLLCSITTLSAEVVHHVLNNGLTVLIHKVQTTQPVSVQLFYNVGSKHEDTHEKGIAHLLEHMVFKGTTSMTESDIPYACHKLSAEFNAMTCHDWTMFYFTIPTQHWHHSLTMLADCMRNCTFKPELLDAELHVVIQELKMYKDHYIRTLFEKLDGAVFTDHPYHYPVIGFKDDLWHMTHENLMRFYKKHYHPNNAVLVVVGNINPDDVIELTEEKFGSIPKDETYTTQTFTHTPDTCTNSITIYRSVSQPQVMLAWTIPGKKETSEYAWNVLAQFMVNAQESPLQTELVDKQQLVYSIGAGTLMRFDSGYFMIQFEPKQTSDIQTIISFIHNEIAHVIEKGIATNKLRKINRAAQSKHYNIMQSTTSQARIIGINYLATGDKDALFKTIITNVDSLHDIIYANIKRYLQPHAMHTGTVLPSDKQQQKEWNDLQQKSDEYDALFLQDKSHNVPVSQPQWAHTIEAQDPSDIKAPIPQEYTLSNNIKLLTHYNGTIPKITIKLQLKADHLYDPMGKEGLYSVMKNCMFEGTNKHPEHTFVQTVQDHAIDLSFTGKTISMSCLKEDCKRALQILHELLTDCTFDETALNKIKQQLISEYYQLWDNPQSLIWTLVDRHIYKDHPFQRSPLGTPESIQSITRDDIVTCYKNTITPDQATIAIVGDIDFDIVSQCESILGSWTGTKVEPILYPEVSETLPEIITHKIDRDQVVVLFARASIDRLHGDYDTLALFDSILSQRLFQLRQQYGIFYTMQGSTTHNCSDQPGIAYIATIVSCDNVERVISIIKNALQEIPQSITEQELRYARQSFLEMPLKAYEKNGSTAEILLFLNKYNLPYNYFDNHKQRLYSISLQEVQSKAAELLDPASMAIFKVGRVSAN